MKRPRFIALTLLLGGCQLLPGRVDPCLQSSSCPQYVQAPFIWGQPNAQTNWIQNGFRSVGGILMVGNRLVVSDGNNRILIWNSFPSSNAQPADLVLGETDFSVLSYNAPPAQQVISPTRLASNGSNLVVATDPPGNSWPKSLLFWNTFPTTNYAAFDFPLNPGNSAPMLGPRVFIGASPLYAGGHLYVGDRGFNRVLIWDTPPITPGDANGALGQTSASSGAGANAGGVSASTFSGPEGSPATDGTSLFVPDTQNHRVLVFNTLPTTSNAAAGYALGQPNTTTNTPNTGGATFSTMNLPAGVAIGVGPSGARLAVADRGNHRVLLWNSLPTTSGQAADLALGQPNPSSVSSNYNGISAATLYSPIAVATDGTKLAVADNGNTRVLLWNSWPTSNMTPADLVLGQPSMTSRATDGEFGTAQRLMAPFGITHAGSSFITSDFDGNRILIWSQFPTDPSAMPTVVLGQLDFVSTSANPGGIASGSLYGPAGVAAEGSVLAVADFYNNRVLLWNTIPTQNRQAADVIIGQAGPTTADQNSGGVALGLNQPQSVCLKNRRLYVADTNNHRVLIWKSIPTQNQQAPDVVLGQSSFTGNMVNRTGSYNSIAGGFSQPAGVYADDTHIFVSDTQNDRILIWNTIDPASGQSPDVVVGASDFASSGSISNPGGLFVAQGRLYVAESSANRISIWNSIPTQNTVSVDSVLGQPSLTGNRPNMGGLSVTSLQRPTSVLVTDVGIYIADNGNGRIVARPPIP